MAVYLEIRKVADSIDAVTYEFSTTDGRCGRLEVDRSTGDIVLRIPLPGDRDGNLFARAAKKVRDANRMGLYPDVLIWAS